MSSDAPATPVNDVVVLRRRSIDRVLIALGLLTTVVLIVAGSLLTWGSNFASDYVGRELRDQKINFPDEATLKGEKRDDLVKYAGQQVSDGDQAEAYASYIQGHVQALSGGKTYAELGGPQRAAQAAVDEAKKAGKTEAELATLQDTATKLSQQRETVYKGETLRGLLLSTYAWSTIGEIAGVAAVVAFVAAALMLVLVILGVFHLRKHAAA